MFDGVIDLSHHNHVADWTAVRRAGIVAVIHKATEGATFRDPRFRERREAARAAGLLWGSYHYSSGVEVAAQVENYLAYADPQPDELVCLDWEESTAGADMSLAQAEEFVALVEARIGRPPVVYGGRHLRETLAGVEASPLARCRLWYARFSDAPRGVPALWARWTLWQHTDGASGAEPREVDGIGPCDRDAFDGTEDELRARWPF
ncbi:glycoside hydrolase family 25 protein [Chenggangzhangella methanolivorans]|uniref:Glycoside hydrolase family 25 protein n=1 Tax=Chenggangzhangella methanolivorans TaxID=1437009 RepID=A0A9E6RDM3_9HYPH|nr:glycoside hydrolase family 25 protein [Chenggangzhangella methanolivorans]QZN99165.1 glycoside hydrolase family 25 protein [Chenggangzhangella methanolivorans]